MISRRSMNIYIYIYTRVHIQASRYVHGYVRVVKNVWVMMLTKQMDNYKANPMMDTGWNVSGALIVLDFFVCWWSRGEGQRFMAKGKTPQDKAGRAE